MKKNIFLILCLLFIFTPFVVMAKDKNEEDLIEKEVVNKVIGMTGHEPTIKVMKGTKDGGYVAIVLYREDNSKYKDNDYKIPGTGGGSTFTKEHSKIIKLDSQYNLVWEKDFFELGNWSNPDPMAETVGTTINGITELNDGSFAITGYVFGLLREHRVGNNSMDDDFDSIYGRISSDGTEMFRKVYKSQGIDDSIAIGALSNGGYIIKQYICRSFFHGEFTDFKIDEGLNEDYMYVVYDNNNKEVESFSDESKLDNYSFINIYDKYQLKYSIRWGEDIKKSIKYLGTNALKESFFMEKNVLKVYDADTHTLKKEYDEQKDLYHKPYSEYIYSGTSFLLLNDGGFIFAGTIFDKDGNKVGKYKDSKEYPLSTYGSYSTTFMSNDGNILFIKKDGSIGIMNHGTAGSSNFSSEDFAKLIIEGKEVNNNIGIFLENDRTYIDLNNLCTLMGCTYKRSEKNNNMLIIDFDAFFNNSNKMIDGSMLSDSQNYTKISYTITHEIGSKKYTSYLSLQPNRIFRLISPTFDESSVDVTSKEKNGQIYVPIRFVSEALGRTVNYKPSSNGEKPVITISAYGEDEFFQNNGVALSFKSYNTGEELIELVNSNNVSLQGKKLYGYGIDKKTNSIINNNKTVFYPLEISNESANLEYNGEDSSRELGNNWNDYTFNGNTISKDDTSDSDSHAFLVISNIKGYPFIKIVNLN